MSLGKSYYDILNIPKNTSDADIKRAYRSLSLKYHPDRTNGDESASELFKTINEAYEILGDPESRAQYDRQLNGPQFDPNNMDALLGMLFGGGIGGLPPGIRVMHGNPNGMHQHGMQFDFGMFMQKPSPIVKIVSISMEQCYAGCNAAFEIERMVSFENEMQPEKETIYVNIPAGIDDNETIILRDKGHLDKMHGDIKIVIQIDNTTPFSRQGMDLILKKTLTLKESLCGFSFHIPHISGKSLNINNTSSPTIVKPGFRKIISGYGMMREGRTGNLIIEFDIEFPVSLTESQIESLGAIL